MDTVLSAVVSELVSRFISFLSKKYRSRACLKENIEMLQHLLLRVHTVVEEAEGRYIENSRMLIKLKTLQEAMYQGYDALDNYLPRQKMEEVEVSGSYMRPFLTARCLRTATRNCGSQVQRALENLETAVVNITEFVMFLMVCERMPRSPYSSYLYIDNFMFGCQVEKLQVINILIQDNPLRFPTVLPIIGGCRVGKKTLVWNICCDDRIRTYYSSILHFTGDGIHKIDHSMFMPIRTLVTVEILSDVTHEEWQKFYSLVACTGKGSKVIIISRSEKHARFGTVNPIRIHSLSHEEYSYLFKVLAFGSANPMDHPKLALIGKEWAAMSQGSLVMLNVYASVLRNNQNVRFWSRVLELFRGLIQKNLAISGEHPKTLLEKHGTAVDITGFSLSSVSGTLFRLVLLTTEKDADKGDLPTMPFGDIIAGSMNLPKKFLLVWKSMLPPYNVICANCVAEMPEQPVSSPRKKRKKSCNLPA